MFAAATGAFYTPRARVIRLRFAPETAAQIEAVQRTAMASASLYVVLTGERAVALIAHILAAERTIWRVTGINAASATTVEIKSDRSLRRALGECGMAAPAQ